jgi:hypothetical protein
MACGASLANQAIEPTNNDPVGVVFSSVVSASRQSVIQFRVRDWLSNRDLPGNSRGDQSVSGAICLSPLLTVTTKIRPKGRYGWRFLEQAGIAHHCGGAMPAWLPVPSTAQHNRHVPERFSSSDQGWIGQGGIHNPLNA